MRFTRIEGHAAPGTPARYNRVGILEVGRRRARNVLVLNPGDVGGDDEVGFARQWGMRTEIEDLRRVVRRASRRGGKVVLGGHSLGGTITTAYATWDFAGRPEARGLSGLVLIDGGSRREPISAGG